MKKKIRFQKKIKKPSIPYILKNTDFLKKVLKK